MVREGAARPALAGGRLTLMAPKEIVLHTATGTRLIEVRHQMRGLSVSRYLLTRPGESGLCRFTTMRKARAAFREQVAKAPLGVPPGTPGA